MFFQVFIWTIIIFILILALIRITLPHIAFLFNPDEIPYKKTQESTEWLNFILTRILSHFQSEDALAQICKIISNEVPLLKKLKPEILSIGTSPLINSVQTFDIKDPGDIRLLVPIEWIRGPSVRLHFQNFIEIEFDLLKFSGKILAEWPPDNSNIVTFSSVGQIRMLFDLTIRFKKYLEFSLLKIPLLGSIINFIVPAFLAKSHFQLNLNAISEQLKTSPPKLNKQL